MPSLFDPLDLGPMKLKNRVVMAPMTRSRAIDNLPNELILRHYAARASAGLIITEGTAPDPNGLGYPRIPGLFSEAQIAGWTDVTGAVHRAGGLIAAQLMHVGRIAHEHNLPRGARTLAPSALRADGTMYTDAEGPMPHATPQAMSAEDIAQTQAGFVAAAKNARTAGFDAIELHGANGYLLEQFLSPHTNRRDDDYGGSMTQRVRFVEEVIHSTADAIGANRVGIRLSPYNTFNDMRLFDDVEATYVRLAETLKRVGALYIHIVLTPDERAQTTAQAIRKAFGGPVILNGGFDRDRAQRALADSQADLISFGRPFIANPDLPARLASGAPLAEPDPNTFYAPGPEGYVDQASRQSSSS